MSLQSVLNAQERAANVQWAKEENARLGEAYKRSADPNEAMGKDEFLKILITQLQNQDPTAPMQDKEFIAQMAQFSTLEQMTNMASDFSKLSQLLKSGEAIGSLGKEVSLDLGDGTIQGVVQAVTRDAVPQVFVNGRYFNWDQVSAVYDTTSTESTSTSKGEF